MAFLEVFDGVILGIFVGLFTGGRKGRGGVVDLSGGGNMDFWFIS